MNDRPLYMALLLLSMTIIADIAPAQSINPEGLYQNLFTGGASGQEAVLIRALPDTQRQYTISNVNGRGIVATIQTDGQISMEPFGVIGQFNSPDTAQLTLPQGTPSQYQLTRIALTGTDFVAYNGQAFAVNPLYAGSWDGIERAYDAVTGVERQDANFPFSFTSNLSAEPAGNGIQGLRSTEFFGGMLNGFFQGVMDTQRSVVIQIGDAEFFQTDPDLAMQTLPGNASSFPVRFIGRGQFQDINTYTNTVLVESREDQPLPPQLKLFLFQQTLTRQQPLTPGDFDGDDMVDSDDRAQIAALFGLNDMRDGYNLLADIDNNGSIDLRDTALLDAAPVETMAIEAGHSGSWFNTQRSGEGWNIVILPNNRAVIAFFSFSPDGSAQVWIVGAGQVVGDEIIFRNLNITSGAMFGDEFDPDDVQRTTWGDIRIYFTDCNNGAIAYGADAVFGNNARPISRLTNLAGIGCGGNPAASIPAQAVTGTWFSPLRDGEGIIFETLPNGQIVMYWYTYAAEGGNQYWLGGVGTFDAATNTAQFEQLRSSSGAAFGDAFSSDDVMQIPWGSARFIQTGCNSGTLEFDSSLMAFGSGSYELTRLTSVASLNCDSSQFNP